MVPYLLIFQGENFPIIGKTDPWPFAKKIHWFVVNQVPTENFLETYFSLRISPSEQKSLTYYNPGE